MAFTTNDVVGPDGLHRVHYTTIVFYFYVYSSE